MPDLQSSGDLIAAAFGLAGVVVGAVTTMGTTVWIDRRSRRDDHQRQVRLARIDRHQSHAESINACLEKAKGLRIAVENYEPASRDSEQAVAVAMAELDVARMRLTDLGTSGKVHTWQQDSLKYLQARTNAADVDTRWQECIEALTQSWNRHLDDVVASHQSTRTDNQPDQLSPPGPH